MKFWTVVFLCAISIVNASLQAPTAASRGSKPIEVLLFDFGLGDNARSPEGLKLENELTLALEKGLSQDKRLRISRFSRTHPAVKRAINEGSIPTGILIPPFTGKSGGEYKAQKLGRLLRAEFTVAGVVDRFAFQTNTKSAEMVVIVEVINTKTNKLVTTLASTITTNGENETEAGIAAVGKFAQEVAPKIIEAIVTPKKEKSGG
ncbi:MAG TPA: hypothetical protein VNK96_04690 [Fimbriimonadales bacterium]|nr:hypothetical protein [Fimbriimonadales bacterium]